MFLLYAGSCHVYQPFLKPLLRISAKIFILLLYSLNLPVSSFQYIVVFISIYLSIFALHLTALRYLRNILLIIKVYYICFEGLVILGIDLDHKRLARYRDLFWRGIVYEQIVHIHKTVFIGRHRCKLDLLLA